MPASRTIAVAFEPLRIGREERETLRGILRYAEERGDRRCTLDPLAAEHVPGPYAGVLGPGSKRLAEACERAGVPFVSTTLFGGSASMSQVAPAYREAGRLAGEHLRDCHYDHFAFVGHRRYFPGSRLEKGFTSALRARARARTLNLFLFPRARDRRTPRRMERLLSGMDRWLDTQELPVGLFAASDALARSVAEHLVRRGLRVPADVGIVGAGNDALLCAAAWPPLTSIDLRLDAVGYRAAEVLDSLIDGAPRPLRPLSLAPRLVPRHSTDRQRLDDPLVAEALRYIARHCHQALRVADVAAAMSVGPRVLLRHFQDVRRHSVRHAIVLARLELARDVLALTDLAIADVARVCGFPTPDRLTQAFRKHCGLTPSAWRERQPPAAAPSSPLERAKLLLANTSFGLDTIALITGYRTMTRLRAALRIHEGMTPRAWRSRHGGPRARVQHRAPDVRISFIGPDGEIEHWSEEEEEETETEGEGAREEVEDEDEEERGETDEG